MVFFPTWAPPRSARRFRPRSCFTPRLCEFLAQKRPHARLAAQVEGARLLGRASPAGFLRKSKTRSRTTAGTETTPRAEAAEGKEQPAVAALGAGRPATGQTQWSLPKTSDCRNPHVCRLPRSGGEKFAAARRAAAYGSTSLSTRSSPAKSGLCATTCRGGLSPSPSSCYSLYTSLQMWSSSSSKSRIARP